MGDYKEYYTISEIARQYGVGVDSLRYYERLGILRPRRGENNYRLYSLGDIYKLNVIRDLRKLGVSMERVRDYLDNQSLDNTLSLLREELDIIREEMRVLQEQDRSIRMRLEELARAESLEAGRLELIRMPDRHCLQLNTDVTRDEEMDFAIKRLHRRHEDKMHIIGSSSTGAFFSLADVKAGRYNRIRSVFFVLEGRQEEPDFVIPGGHYLSYHYRGGYEQGPGFLQAMLLQAERLGCRILGDPLELYKIDIHETKIREEYLTEIQIRVSPAKNEEYQRRHNHESL